MQVGKYKFNISDKPITENFEESATEAVKDAAGFMKDQIVNFPKNVAEPIRAIGRTGELWGEAMASGEMAKQAQNTTSVNSDQLKQITSKVKSGAITVDEAKQIMRQLPVPSSQELKNSSLLRAWLDAFSIGAGVVGVSSISKAVAPKSILNKNPGQILNSTPQPSKPLQSSRKVVKPPLARGYDFSSETMKKVIAGNKMATAEMDAIGKMTENHQKILTALEQSTKGMDKLYASSGKNIYDVAGNIKPKYIEGRINDLVQKLTSTDGSIGFGKGAESIANAFKKEMLSNTFTSFDEIMPIAHEVLKNLLSIK